jgi:hypothetical protein
VKTSLKNVAPGSKMAADQVNFTFLTSWNFYSLKVKLEKIVTLEGVLQILNLTRFKKLLS